MDRRLETRLEGMTAIVTGGGTGVGAACALRLAEKGANVAINYSRSAEAAEAVAATCREHGVDAIAMRADVARDEDCRALVAAAADRWGRVDILVNSAGTTRFIAHADLEAVKPEDFDAIFGVNLKGPFQMSRAVAPHMRARGAGAIVNISSASAMTGAGSSIPYAASKGALNTLTKSLARVFAPEIRVNAVCPDFITGRWLREGVGAERHDAVLADVQSRAALGKVATPDDVAETVLWFIEQAGFITGETLVMDAGVHLGRAG